MGHHNRDAQSIWGKTMYHPPAFGLIHFDDADPGPAGQTTTRWLSSWQGPADQPAEQVTLGWARGQRTVIVVATCTVARLPHKADRREDAVFQAVGGYP